MTGAPLRPRRLANLSAPAAASALRPTSVLIQPIAAVEQHGPHLPLSTDLLITDAAAEAVMAQAGDELDLWLLPTFAYGKSNEHEWAPGTVTLSATTVLAMLDDLGRSLARLPARRLVFLNGHGGNTALLQVALREIRVAHGLETFLMHPFAPPESSPGTDPEGGWGIHGGHVETSMLMHVRPDLVDMSLTASSVPDWPETTSLRPGGSVVFGWTSADLGLDGVIGNPTEATAEAGKVFFEAAVAQLVGGLAEISAHGLPPRRVRP